MKFYICKKCGNIIAFADYSGAPVSCCGEEMTELKENTTDAAQEKHVPVILTDKENITVKVGEVAHPMTKEHWIKWIAIETEQGNQRKTLNPGDKPECCFRICKGDKVIKAYAYCNLHGLWTSVKLN